jgi:4-hydroxy-tetrahydrodipicolinate reductase
MKIILVGYGQMGKQIELVAEKRGHGIVARIDPVSGDTPKITPELANEADGIVEFSLPEAPPANARIYGELGLNAVVGTTGWYDRISEVKKTIESGTTAYLWGSNFSIGAQIFFRIVAQASRMIDPLPEFDIMGYEIHHKRKKDSPSGTAQRIAEIILENMKRKNRLVTERLDRPISEGELHFASVRGGEVPGIHRILLDSSADTIELTHTARNRGGMALGAVMAFEWLQGKRGFFSVEDFIQDLF